MDLSPPKKRPSRHFSIEDKEQILNIFKACTEVNPNNSKTENVTFTAKAAGVADKSVYNILREYKETHILHPPTVYHRQRAIMDNIDDEAKSNRRVVHSFFANNDPPTLKKILSVLLEHKEMPLIKRTTLRNLLHEIGFRYSKRSRNSYLKEKSEMVAWRRRYLRQIRKCRDEGTKIYYLDETWVNEGHTVTKVCKDTTILHPRQAFINGLTTGLKDPSGKGKRLIVLHIGSEEGFVERGLCVFESKKTGDYHQEMTAAVFEQWFENILNDLNENAVIVLDNASYHSRKHERIPNTGTEKAAIENLVLYVNLC